MSSYRTGDHLPRRARVAWATRALFALATACSSGGTEPAQPRIVVDRTAVSLYHGRVDTLRTTVYDGRGVATDLKVGWVSSDSQVAAPGPDGVLYGRSPGRTTILAVLGTLSAKIDVTVRPDTKSPALSGLQLSAAEVDLSGGNATVGVTVRVRDAESGVQSVSAGAALVGTSFSMPTRAFCSSMTLVAGTKDDGTWRCEIALHRYRAPGEWRITARANDWPWPPNGDSVSTTITVRNALPDDTPPTLTELRFTDERVTDDSKVESRIMIISATDGESGVESAEFFLDSDQYPGIYGCGAGRPQPDAGPWNPLRVATQRCPVPLVDSAGPVHRTINLVRLQDSRGNTRSLSRADLERMGIVTRIDIRK